MKRKVLFLCETNGLQSPIAEALLRRIDPEHFEAVSAGASQGQLHPVAVEVMKEIGIDLSQTAPKHIKSLTDDNFDYVITLDESSRRLTGNFQSETIHWKFDNPIGASGDPERQLRAFRMVRDQISQRLRLFVIVNVPHQTPSRPAA